MRLIDLLLQIEHFQQSLETLQARNKQIEQNNQIKTKENQDLLQQIANLQVEILFFRQHEIGILLTTKIFSHISNVYNKRSAPKRTNALNYHRN